MRVKAIAPGYYGNIFRDIGDVFDLANSGDLSDSTVNQVPSTNPDSPVYGWMLVVPGTTPLFSWALSAGGASNSLSAVPRWVL